MSEPFIGQIIMFGGTFAIRGFAECAGQLEPISQNTALFSILGTTYGGDGHTTFALPDLRGRAPVGSGQGPGLSPRREGQRYGYEQITLTVLNMPPHNHPAQGGGAVATQSPGQSNSPSQNNNMLATPDKIGRDNVNIYAPADGDTVTLSGSDIAIGNTGGGQPFPVESPSLVINFQIALTGIFPPRD